mgnify:CR=1 FL=1
MRTLAIPLLVITSLLLAVSIGMHLASPGSSEESSSHAVSPPPTAKSYRPALEKDPPVPEPPEKITARGRKEARNSSVTAWKGWISQ